MRRQVYGSIYSYPSGVVLAVMVARACQVMPASHPSVVLRFFFMFYTVWLTCHDHISPIFITASLEARRRIPGLPESWSPQKAACREDLLPVINPAYPYVNDARNVGRCGLEVFYAELTLAHRILSNTDAPIDDIWVPYNIKSDYSRFLLVQVSCESKEEDDEGAKTDLAAWSSYVASKLRFFIYGVERIVNARPHPHKLDDSTVGSLAESRRRFKSSYFAIGVRKRNDDRKLQMSMFTESFENFSNAVREGCTDGKGGRGFQYNKDTMQGPWFSLVDAEDLPSAIVR
ncbi:putative poly(A) polymerase, putative,polynucleotide adenylyltransferase [Trypanosoma grayi]|uniref:putative poly(A) polymerase, putative,polynucleotide adenylyltransferase n=1 Tax=Trypanosoma grayi TaxID=71804 RepID=UPI0004F446DA|nr:putative poly(A) polymerase, putative,polynucleotide adenylyltransferase [Trypanosoma grayi]KEG14072.1 putative poly(A) polymerase, putative,polynucleotide adenylyltransferase [Trypanosoma grayi]